MKSVIGSLSVLGALMVSGCQTTQGLQTPDSDLARRILANHCVVGLKTMGTNTISAVVREGAVSKHNDAKVLHHVHKVQADQVFIYSVKDLSDGWVVVDATTQRVRDNFYFNRGTGEFACSTSEWRYARSDSMVRTFEVTPLIPLNGKWGLSD